MFFKCYTCPNMTIEQSGFVIDRNYGEIQYSESELRLFQTKEITRLRQISLSTTPPWMVRGGYPATRFEHSLGVANLAKIVGQNPNFSDIARDLYFASLFHDAGSPPFSHLSDGFMEKHLGIEHERHAISILSGSEYAAEVKKLGGSLKNIEKLILGDKKLLASEVLNGSLDIDNLDNILRYGVSIGLYNKNSYSPETIAASFDIKNGHVVLNDICLKDLESWVRCRKVAYDYVYSTQNGAPGSMVHRALDLASKGGRLNTEFFGMTDIEASNYLETKCGKEAANLIQRANRWMFYLPAVDIQTTTPSERLKILSTDEDYRGMIADDIARTLQIPYEDVCVYLRQGRNFRKIHLPVVDGNGHEVPFEQNGATNWVAQVYLYRDHSDKMDKAADLFKSIIEE